MFLWSSLIYLLSPGVFYSYLEMVIRTSCLLALNLNLTGSSSWKFRVPISFVNRRQDACKNALARVFSSLLFPLSVIVSSSCSLSVVVLHQWQLVVPSCQWQRASYRRSITRPTSYPWWMLSLDSCDLHWLISCSLCSLGFNLYDDAPMHSERDAPRLELLVLD